MCLAISFVCFQYVLEGHTGEVASVSFIDDGRLLASLGAKGTMLIWRTDTWQEAFRVQKIGDVDLLSHLATHPTRSIVAALGKEQKEINLWDLDLALLRGASTTPAVFYVNAKAVLLGESGVGKSGLGIRIAEKNSARPSLPMARSSGISPRINCRHCHKTSKPN